MLLIGSRAAKFHFPKFRKPKDWDFIASEQEVNDFLSNYQYLDTSAHAKKRRAQININGEIQNFEFDLTNSYLSNEKIIELETKNLTYNSDLDIDYYICSPETLFLLKKSHIIFNINWEKNISDYLFLKNKINNFSEEIFNLRFEETKNKLNFKEFNFNVGNSDFFKKSEKFVQRSVEHDSIHYATCFGDKPIFLSAKKDISQAALDEDLISKFSHDLKVKMIQEEIMALSLERYIIPNLLNNKKYDAKKAYQITSCKMVYNYLPLFLRFFAADNFIEISKMPFNYVDKFLLNHEEFK